MGAIGHLTGQRQYADALTKDDSQELFMAMLYGGVVDFRHARQNWSRITWGREQLEWQEALRGRVREQPHRLELLLEKGGLRGGTLG